MFDQDSFLENALGFIEDDDMVVDVALITTSRKNINAYTDRYVEKLREVDEIIGEEFKNYDGLDYVDKA